MGNRTKALGLGLVLLLLALPTRAADDLYSSQIVEQARLWQQKNRDDLAANLWRKLLASDPKHPEALLRLGVIEARTGNIGEAEALLRRATQSNPTTTRLQDLSDAIKTAKGVTLEKRPLSGAKEALKSAPPAKEPPKATALFARPAAKEAASSRAASVQSKKPLQIAPAKISPPVDPTLDATETMKPKAAGETELNLSTSLNLLQISPRP